MKTKFSIYLLVLLLLLSACGIQTALPAPKDAALGIQSATAFTPELQELPAELIQKYVGLEADQYSEIYMLLDTSRGSTEQILFINAKDKAEQEKIVQSIEAYKASLINQYRDYVPEEVPKLEAAILRSKGLQTVFIVSGDSAACDKKLNELWK